VNSEREKMKLIELHILQSFPVSCLNRDDVGAPKTAVFGGATRARISSQCLKRAARIHAKEECPELFKGERSKLIVDPIVAAVVKNGAPEDKAAEAAKAVCDALASFDERAEKSKGVRKVKTLMFLSPREIDGIGLKLAELIKEGHPPRDLGKKLKKVAEQVGEAQLQDAADIALFGRMVATDHSLTVEGAAMFSHALSTHRADNDIDFYTAVDDRQADDPAIEDEDRAGSGMMGTLEFTSAVYYRYVALNLGMLFNNEHLEVLTQSERKKVVDAFVRGVILAVPEARKNSMNAHTLPGYVLGVVREKGQPVQLVNAFEKPISSKQGLLDKSIEQLKAHRHHLRTTWSLDGLEVEIPDKTLADFCTEIAKHV
jgi:CRISPR system Cascade subunit CasC